MRPRALRTVLVFAGVLTAACPISPEEELGECGPLSECPTGASCLVNMCVADGIFDEGETCSRSEQCNTGLVCSTSPFVCRRPCAAPYAVDSTCRTAEYCRPASDVSGALQPVCVPGDCAISPTCDVGELCVPVGSNAGACLRACEYVIEIGGAYHDTCGGSITVPQSCQPVGASGEEVLVCFDLGERTVVDEAEACDLGDRLCGSGLGCWRGACHRYCEPATVAPCSGGDVCCSITTGEDSFGLCMAGCN